jgi:hypothetical protein
MAKVTVVPEVIDADALAFANLRATYLESPRVVADDLLAAADSGSSRLKGVTPYQARMRAAFVLSAAGDYRAEREVLDSSPDTAGARLIQQASVCVATDDVAGAQALVSQIRSWPVGDTYGLSFIIECVLTAAKHGHFEQALAWTDAAWQAAISNRTGSDFVAMAGGPTILRLAGEQIRELQQRRAAGDIQAQAEEPEVQSPGATGPERALVAGSQPWPALSDGRLLWWPDWQYQRLVAQVPDVQEVLGATWQQHRAKVESALTAVRQVQGSRAALSLVRAEFSAYVRFLERAGADPRLADAMTAFTGSAAAHQKPDRWPPGRLDRCWCGSGRRYSRCCGALGGS